MSSHEWTSLGEALAAQVMSSPAFTDEDKAIFLESMARGKERQERLRGGEAVEPRPIDWAHDGSEIHEDRKPGYRCFICHDSGFVRRDVDIYHKDFGRALPCRCRTEDPAFAAAKMRRLLDRNGLPAPLQETTLASFAPVEGTSQALLRAQEFIDTMKNLQEPRWLTFFGPPGSGKTHLLAGLTIAVCVEIGVQALYFDVRNFLKACKGNSFERDEVWTNAAQDCPVLVFDELLSHHDRDWDLRKLETVLMERWTRTLPTILAITRSEEELQEWSPALYSRLSDTTRARKIHLETGDYRQR